MDRPEAQDISPVSDPLLPVGSALRSALMLTAAACWLASAGCIMVMAVRGASVAWVVAWFTSPAASLAVIRMADIYWRYRHSGRVVEQSSLDESCGQLLRRTQLAIGAILGSEIYAADLLSPAAGEIALRRHEWEIASTLREITALRSEFDANLAGASRGPVSDAVLESHRRALALAQEATTSRACARERHAAQILPGDAAGL